VHENLHLKPYKLKLLQVLAEGNTVRRAAIRKDFIPRLEEDTLNLYLVCSVEAVFFLPAWSCKKKKRQYAYLEQQ
jgi:hypothetical protein